MKHKIAGYRGYIGSRSYSGIYFPQSTQNFLIRNYCQKQGLTYFLSATEYKMPGCYIILEEILSTLDSLEGVVLFSIFMLPESAKKRKDIYKKILSQGKTLHAALEDICIKNEADILKIENILDINKIALTDHSLDELRDFLT